MRKKAIARKREGWRKKAKKADASSKKKTSKGEKSSLTELELRIEKSKDFEQEVAEAMAKQEALQLVAIHELGEVVVEYTANISAVPSTVNCGVTFPTVIWQYSELLMTLSCCGYCHQRY